MEKKNIEVTIKNKDKENEMKVKILNGKRKTRRKDV